MTIFHHKLLTKDSSSIGQWMHPYIIHDVICSLIYKKCHLKSYHIDIKYHMTIGEQFK